MHALLLLLASQKATRVCVYDWCAANEHATKSCEVEIRPIRLLAYNEAREFS